MAPIKFFVVALRTLLPVLIVLLTQAAVACGAATPAPPVGAAPTLAAPIVTVLTGTPAPAPSPTLAPSATATPPVLAYTYRVVQRYPHDTGAFTEGLVFDNGFLYESTGLQGQSTLRQEDLTTGAVLRQQGLAPQYFGEGLTVFQGELIQLTWQTHVGFVYALDSLSLQKQFSYPTEGWGLTQDGQRLIMSDGSSTLYFLDPKTFEKVGQVDVKDAGNPLTQLNELEYINGEIYANVWKKNLIARINPNTGRVEAWINLAGLLSPPDRPSNPEDVLNGIAYDPAGDRLFVTGKGWPYLFQIDLVAASP